MPAPTTINAIRLQVDLQWANLLGNITQVLAPLTGDYSLAVGPPHSDGIYADATVTTPQTKVLWAAASSVVPTILLGVVQVNAAALLVITGGAAASSQNLMPNVPYFIHTNTTATQVSITITSGVIRGMCAFWGPVV